jgi:copper chaperone CopZ
MRTRIWNACLIITVIAILGVFAVYVRVGATADAVVVLDTSGMTCGACADKVAKALQCQKGVASTEVDLDSGRVMAGFDSKQVAPAALAQKVTETGFKCKVDAVLTPAEYKAAAGHNIGDKGTVSSCCGAKGCRGK